MKSSGGAKLEMMEAVCTSFDDYFFNNHHMDARPRSLHGSYFPGSAVLIFESIVARITYPLFQQPMEDNPRMVGNLKPDPTKGLEARSEADKSWRAVEALERPNGKLNLTARGNDSTTNGKAKVRSEKQDGKSPKGEILPKVWGSGAHKEAVPSFEEQGERAS